MITITEGKRTGKPPADLTGSKIPVGTLFRASVGHKSDNTEVFLKVYKDVVDLQDPENTYDGATRFYGIVELDGELIVSVR